MEMSYVRGIKEPRVIYLGKNEHRKGWNVVVGMKRQEMPSWKRFGCASLEMK